MPDAYNGRVRLAYERRGQSDADTVVFVEGLAYGRWMWRWQREALADYQVHPEHEAVKEFIGAVTAERWVVDYEG